jgi:hypothetical protein
MLKIGSDWKLILIAIKRFFTSSGYQFLKYILNFFQSRRESTTQQITQNWRISRCILERLSRVDYRSYNNYDHL